MTIVRYCSCGVVLKTSEASRKKRQRVLMNWADKHYGHTWTDAAGAEAARMGTNVGMGRESRREEQG